MIVGDSDGTAMTTPWSDADDVINISTDQHPCHPSGLIAETAPSGPMAPPARPFGPGRANTEQRRFEIERAPLGAADRANRAAGARRTLPEDAKEGTMTINQRLRTIFRTAARRRARHEAEPAFGDPTKTLMARGGGELAGAHDAQWDELRAHDFGSPNDAIDNRVRPPLS
jgi:hypothetical protein